MTHDPVDAARQELLATPYVEGSDRTREKIDRLIAAETSKRAAEQQSGRYVSTGSVRIALPEPEPEVIAPPAAPALELPARFAPFAEDLTRAEAEAQRQGFASYIGALAMVAGLQPHEVTPRSATAEERMERADRCYDKLVGRLGVERAEAIIQGWRAAVTTLGVGKLFAEHGFDTADELVEYVGSRWLAEMKR